MNNKNNSLYFKFKKCNHKYNFFKKIIKIVREIFKQIDLYVFSSNKFVVVLLSSKLSKYRILFKQKKFVQNFLTFAKSSFKSIVKNVFDENDNFLKFEIILFKKLKIKNKITNAIIKTRSSTLITKFINYSNYSKKIIRKNIANFKNLSFIDFKIFENILIEKILNIIFINVVVFQNLLNFRKRKNNYKIFSFYIKKIVEILKSFETTRNDILKNLKIHIISQQS